MDELRGKYRIPHGEPDFQVGSGSAVLSQTFVGDALKRDRPRDDGLNAFRGAVNGVLISLVFWIALGFVIFGLS